MYRYDEYDRQMVNARVAEFRDQVSRRLSGELDEEHFRPLRLMNGLYLQLHAYMLRIAIPYGTLAAGQLRKLADIARRYDRGYGHFTTRQNIQFNWIKLEHAPDILAELATVDMHSIQTSGNCIRNISSDQYAGAAAGEIDDPRPWAELMRQWSSFHPEFSWLPRKFKIAVIATDTDRSALRWHDIGVQLVRRDGRLGFRVYVGGGMGRTPVIAPLINEFVPAEQILSYFEAALRVYNRYGRRDNQFKARIKILVQEIGAERYTAEVAEEFLITSQLGIDPPPAEIARIRAGFAPPPFEVGLASTIDRRDAAFAHWADRQVKPHKAPGYAIVNISLKGPDIIPGDASADQMEAIAGLAEQYSFGEIRVTHSQNLVLPHVRIADLPAVFAGLRQAGLAHANLDLASDIIACPGLDYCTLANARSIPLAQKLGVKLKPREEELGELKIKISGCINACGHHHAGHIGILGVDRKGVESYQLLLGGSGAEDASAATILGPGFSEDGVVQAIETVTDVYLAQRQDGERLLDTWRRLGAAPFKAAVYGGGDD